MIKRVLVLGGGSAGFIAGITLKRFLPHLSVRIVRSKDIGIIGVGEGTTDAFPKFIHEYLGITPNDFVKEASPIWKLGLRFMNWGPRPFFDYTFAKQVTLLWKGLPKPAGFYCAARMEDCGSQAALMTENRVFARTPQGVPHVESFGYHIENKDFVAFLESRAARLGVEILDDTVTEVMQDERGVAGLRMQSGTTHDADLYVDSSGFFSVLLGKTFNEPFVSFRSTLFCDQAVVGGWDREPDEPIQPYTTVEGMDAGWCWRIDHEKRINRGYVHSSSFISPEEADGEFRQKNPKVRQTRLVKFVTGRYARTWVKNVVGVGNACGFVEPLEATSLMEICSESYGIANALLETDLQPRPNTVDHYNRWIARRWDGIRDFLGIHYRFNTRFDTPFWRACRADVDVAGAAEIVEYFRENGPGLFFRNNLLWEGNQFGLEGYWSLLVGQDVPFRRTHVPAPQELALWEQIRTNNRAAAKRGFTTTDLLTAIRTGQGGFG